MSQHSIVNPNQAVYSDGNLLLDFAVGSVTLDGNRVQLTSKEYQLLAHMVQHAGEILSRDALLRDVWGYGPSMQTRTLDVHVRRLRKKLGRYAHRGIETLFGVGYRFQPRQDAAVPGFQRRTGPASSVDRLIDAHRNFPRRTDEILSRTTPMKSTKIIVAYPQPKDVKAFDAVYQNEHVPLAIAKLEGKTKIVATKVLQSPQGEPPFYCIAEVHFPSMEALQACAGSIGGQETLAHAARISSGGPPVVMIAEEDTFTF